MARNIDFVGGELQVNLLDPLPRPLPPTENGLLGTQENPEVTALPNGNFVVAYTNDAGDSGDIDILAIEFTAAGTVVGNVFRVDFDPTGDQFQPDVAPVLSGGYAVAFRDGGTDGNNNNSLSLVLVPPGSLPDPPEFTVEDLTGNLLLTDPSIATFANGSYIVTYDLFADLAVDDFDTRFAIVNAAGNARLTGPTPLSETDRNEFDTAVATFGNLAAIVFTSEERSSVQPDIVLKIVDSSGATLDTEIIDTAGDLFNPEVAALADGRFVLIWHDWTSTDAYGQIYDPVAGTFSGPAFVVSDRGGYQVSPRVTALPDGGFLATWEDYSGSFGDNSAAINGRRFDANGVPVGDEFRISTSTQNNQLDPSVATNDAGIVFTVWSNFNTINTTDDDPFGIQGQFLQPVTEQIIGTAGDDTFQTYGLGERITTHAGDDTIHAGDGDDVIDAGKGNDLLDGQAGSDLLIGGWDKDKQFGGLGADIFDFNKLAESKAGAAFRDILKDFRHSEGDRIDLSDLDADTNASPGNQKFTFIGADAFSGTDGELRFVDGLVQGDTNGDGIANFEIKVKTGGVPLVAEDFVL